MSRLYLLGQMSSSSSRDSRNSSSIKSDFWRTLSRSLKLLPPPCSCYYSLCRWGSQAIILPKSSLQWRASIQRTCDPYHVKKVFWGIRKPLEKRFFLHIRRQWAIGWNFPLFMALNANILARNGVALFWPQRKIKKKKNDTRDKPNLIKLVKPCQSPHHFSVLVMWEKQILICFIWWPSWSLAFWVVIRRIKGHTLQRLCEGFPV